jgi:hypothetical protein
VRPVGGNPWKMDGEVDEEVDGEMDENNAWIREPTNG